MTTITIHKAKTNLSRLIKKACQGEEVVIARGSEPVVRLVPITGARGDRKPGALKGKLKVGPEFFEPLPPEELKFWE
ncbi:MAG TPA: type II toxin-antitoxin system prevent-host-death family antitoxin [Terriglobales bacterium]|jgi:prevent-host-death family protein|nr:type II toxin-antitoxin system prevent-host-death family antitoxin [Terriglobales bacterium]